MHRIGKTQSLDDKSSDVGTTRWDVTTQVKTFLLLSVRPLQHRSLAYSQSSPTTEFYTSKVQNAPQTHQHYGSDDKGKLPVYLGLHPVAQCRSKHSKTNRFLSERMSMPLFSHENRAIFINISMEKLEIKGTKVRR